MTQEINWRFDNSYLQLPQKLYSQVSPSLVRDPSCIFINKNLSKDLGLCLDNIQDQELATIFSGNYTPSGAKPIAQAYAGHQYGYFNILGDGRAILLGEHLTPDLHRYDIQLKGAGVTPYSRSGDGRATLSSMLREYIISEAMYYLGIPTTRSLAVVKTGEMIRREKLIPGAVLTRVATSHIRIGTFQYASFLQDNVLLKKLTDYTINRHYSEISVDQNPYLAFLNKIIDKQAFLIAKWLGVGFIHGVMNTDNMSISGETIDYGPCAFMDKYDTKTVFSSIDRNGRYAYANQANIAMWNLARLAETLLPLIDQNHEKAIELATNAISSFEEKFNQYWLNIMRKKLGLDNEKENDINLINDLLNWMQKMGADYTNTFRDLASENKLSQQIYQNNDFKSWEKTWQERLKLNTISWDEAIYLMNANNPYIIPRNYLVEEALIKATNGDVSSMVRLLEALHDPFTENKNYADLAAIPKESLEAYKTFCGT